MNVTIESATLEKFSAFTKKTDLTVYGQYTFKTTEEGSPTLLGQFSNNTYLAKLSQMASNDTWTKVCVPMDEEVTVKFDGATFDGILSELSVKRNLEKQKTSYSFTVEKELDAKEVDSLVIPYFKARQEAEDEKSDPLKGPKYVPMKFVLEFNN
jgi:hypothetical protein